MNDQGKHTNPHSSSNPQGNYPQGNYQSGPENGSKYGSESGSASGSEGIGHAAYSQQTAGDDSLNAEKLKQQGRETAHEMGEAAHQQAEHLYESQRNAAAEQAHKFTGVMQKMADEFDQQQQPYFSQQTRKLADCAGRFSNTLREKDLRSICHEAQSYSQREPAIFIGGAIAAGFLVSRFLRSSSHHSSSSSSSSSSASTPSQHSASSAVPPQGMASAYDEPYQRDHISSTSAGASGVSPGVAPGGHNPMPGDDTQNPYR